MKVLILFVFTFIFLLLSMSMNGPFASMLKGIITWGSFLFLAMVAREMWKIKHGIGKNNKWDEDP